MNQEFAILEQAQDVIQEAILDESTKKKNYYLSGIYTQCEISNNNNRTYPKAIVEREINNVILPKIKKGVSFGEFGHPKNIKEMKYINEAKVSHRIVEIREDGNNYIGKSVIIPEGMGKIAIGIIETGGILSVSSRATGSLKNGIVQENYSMNTYDLVFDGGMPKSNQTAILENKDLFVEETGFLTPEQWIILEKNRHKLLENHLLKFDLLYGLQQIKNIGNL